MHVKYLEECAVLIHDKTISYYYSATMLYGILGFFE